MKPIVLLILLSLLVVSIHSYDVGLNNSSQLYRITESTDNYMDIEFSLASFQESIFSTQGKDYKRISHDKAGYLTEKGLPEVPVFGTFIAIPPSVSATCSILSTEEKTFKNYQLFPSQDGEDVKTGSLLRVNEDFYRTNSNYPTEKVVLGSQAVMRDLNIMNITFQPFSYNSKDKELKVNDRIKVRITYNQPITNLPLTTSPRMSRYFADMYSDLIVNYDQIRDELPPVQQPCILIIYPNGSNNPLQSSIDQLVLWKKQRGFEVHTINIAQNQNTTGNIKAQIQNAYDTYPNKPDFIILVGNPESNSTSLQTNMVNYQGPYPNPYAGDYPYTFLTGNDTIGDAFIGRLSVDSASNLQTIIAKIKLSERNPNMAATDWYNRTLLVADTSPSGTSCIDVSMLIKEMTKDYNPAAVFTEIFPTPSAATINTGLNAGNVFFNYRGYIGMSGWTAGDIATLSNVNKLCNAVILTCDTGAFADGTSRIEAFVTAGSPTSPKGAYTAMGMSTSHTHTGFNNCLDVSTFDGIYRHGQRTMGQAMYYAKQILYQSYYQANLVMANTFNHWCNLMGDPSMDIIVGIPKTMNVSYPVEIPLGTPTVTVQATDSANQPLENVWVTVSNSSVSTIATGYTNTQGQIVLNLPQTGAETLTVTVSKPDYLPHNGTLNISSNPCVVYQSMTIDDDNSNGSQGNSNGIINNGETDQLNIVLKNNSSAAVNNIGLTVTTTDPWVTVLVDSVYYGSLAAQASSNITAGIMVQVNPACPDQHPIKLDLQIASSLGNFTSSIIKTCAGADLDILSNQVVDNNNSTLNPGEICGLKLTIKNNGQNSASDITASLRSGNPYLTVSDSMATFGNVNSQAQSTCNSDYFTLSAGMQLFEGQPVPMTVIFQNTTGYYEEENFVLTVGTTSVSQPFGPDSYGYVCYDSWDTSYEESPEYNWIELSPNTGTLLPINDMGENSDETVTVNMPFNFKFYGISYNQISVCSNGWISFGPTQTFSFRNYPLPGPMAPAPIIAAFWDDLVMDTSSGIYTYYSTVEHAYIVQWQSMKNAYSTNPNNRTETFQVLLYDPLYYPTMLGDGKIKIQYKIFNNVDNQSGTEHGSYSTIGIQDHRALTGLQYTYNNQYSPGAHTLTNESAILFTGLPVSYDNAHLLMASTAINGEANVSQIPAGSDFQLGVGLKNLGNMPAQTISASISTNDPYVTITNPNSAYNPIPTGEIGFNTTYFGFTVNNNCPNNRMILFTINISSANENLSYNFEFTVKKGDISTGLLIFNDSAGNLNGVPDAGETLDMALEIVNNSVTNTPEISVMMSSTSPYIQFNTNNIYYGTIKGNEKFQKNWNITISNSTPPLSYIPINIISYSNNVPVDTTFISLPVSVPPQLLTEDFDNGIPDNWTTLENPDNWNSVTSDYAGGTSPEIVLSWNPQFNGTSRLASPSLNLMGSSNLSISFRHSVDIYQANGGYELGLAIRNETTDWTTLWSINPSTDIVPQTITTAIPQNFVNQPNVQLSWYLTGDSFNLNYWYLDNVNISGISGNNSTLNGTISLNNFPENMTDVRIKAGTFVTAPNADGTYKFILPPMVYPSVTATLSGYYGTGVNNIELVNNQNMIINFNLSYLTPPQNLSYSLNNNNLTLTWNAQSLRTNSRKVIPAQNNRFVLQYYQIYRQTNTGEFVRVDSTTATSYTQVIDSQNIYRYYVKAQYVEGLSDASNPIVTNVSNHSPVVVNAIQNFSMVEDTPDNHINLLQVFNDPDNDDLTYNCGGNTHFLVQINNGLVTLTPTLNWFGTETLIFRAVDTWGLSATSSVLVTVTPVDDPPVLNFPAALNYNEDSPLQVNFAEFVTDIDTPPANYSLTWNGNVNTDITATGLMVTISNHTPNWNGQETVTFIINDGVTAQSLGLTRNHQTKQQGQSARRNRNDSRNTYNVNLNLNCVAVNDVPVINSHIPAADTVTVNYSTPTAFSVNAQDVESTVTYQWFVNDQQAEGTTPAVAFAFPSTGTYQVKVAVSDGVNIANQIWTVHAAVSNADPAQIPQETALFQNYPNPFNPTTTIKFALHKPGKVIVDIYNPKGQLVKRLTDKDYPAGYHNLVWDGKDSNKQKSASGIYFYRLQTTDYQKYMKALLIK